MSRWTNEGARQAMAMSLRGTNKDEYPTERDTDSLVDELVIEYWEGTGATGCMSDEDEKALTAIARALVDEWIAKSTGHGMVTMSKEQRAVVASILTERIMDSQNEMTELVGVSSRSEWVMACATVVALDKALAVLEEAWDIVPWDEEMLEDVRSACEDTEAYEWLVKAE